jgi:hypothetical protein
MLPALATAVSITDLSNPLGDDGYIICKGLCSAETIGKGLASHIPSPSLMFFDFLYAIWES